MSDFTYHLHPRCSSLDGYSVSIRSHSSDSMYRVSWTPHPDQGTDDEGWVCQCKGFMYRRECRHVREAKETFCGWDGAYDAREPVIVTRVDGSEMKLCPKCRSQEITFAYHAA